MLTAEYGPKDNIAMDDKGWDGGWHHALRQVQSKLVEAREKINDDASLRVIDEFQNHLRSLEKSVFNFRPTVIAEMPKKDENG